MLVSHGLRARRSFAGPCLGCRVGARGVNDAGASNCDACSTSGRVSGPAAGLNLAPRSPQHRSVAARAQGAACCSTGHSHDHHHHHGNDHDHQDHHEHHGHHHPHFENFATAAMDKIGLSAVADKISHSWACAAASLGFFIVALVVQLPLIAKALPGALAEYVHNACLAGTFVLSGVPQFVESVGAAASLHIDTHGALGSARCGPLCMPMSCVGIISTIVAGPGQWRPAALPHCAPVMQTLTPPAFASVTWRSADERRRHRASLP